MNELDPQVGAETGEDHVLLSRIALKDQKAFESLYKCYSPRLFRYAKIRLRDAHLAEEAVQESLWAVWQSANKFSGKSKPSTWIFGIAHHKVTDLLKKQIAQRQIQNDALRKPSRESQISAERQDQIERALASISEVCRDALVLSFFYRFDYKEIGQILGCKEGTVKNRIFRGKEQLREFLKRRQGGE